jgi:hypothetical protein
MSSSAWRDFAEVEISDDVRALAGDQIETMVTHLRTSGADCRSCGQYIRHSDRASLTLELSAIGVSAVFYHIACGPSRVHDLRGSRRSARSAEDRRTALVPDVVCFLAFRSSPNPRAWLLVSSVNPMTLVHRDGGGTIGAVMARVLAGGMSPVAAPVVDASPPSDVRWTVAYTPSTEILIIRCQGENTPFYEGSAAPLSQWSEAIDEEHECLVLYSHVGVRSDLLGEGTFPAIDAIARKGLVAGVVATATITEHGSRLT